MNVVVRRGLLLVAFVCCSSGRSLAGEWVQNKFSVKECDRILHGAGEAPRTLKAVLGAIQARSCSDVPVDAQGRTTLTSIDLHGQKLTDLSPEDRRTGISSPVLSTRVVR
jgi:hypothetical protein